MGVENHSDNFEKFKKTIIRIFKKKYEKFKRNHYKNF